MKKKITTRSELIIECCKCHQKPAEEFILLLCDHILCSQCLEGVHLDKKMSFDGVKCPCGLVTYFSPHRNQINSFQSSKRSSVGTIRSRTSTETKGIHQGRFRTQCSALNEKMDLNENANSVFMFQKSQYPIQSLMSSRRSSKMRPTQTLPLYHQGNSLKENRSLNANAVSYSISDELNKELKYLKVKHEKMMGDFEIAYRKAVKFINSRYEQMQSHLKDLCLENIILNQPETQVELTKVIQLKYEGEIATQVQSMMEAIKKYGSKKTLKVRNCSSSPSRQLIDIKEAPSSIANNYSKIPNFSKPNDLYACKHGKLHKRGGRKRNIIIEL